MNYLKKELYELIKEDASIFDFIQDSALDGLWYWDLENPEQEWMNPKFWKTLGYDPDKMPHLASAWQNIINQEDLKVAIENFKMHCADPNHPYDQVVRYTHKRGHDVWIRCKGLAIRNKDDAAIRMLGAHTDVSELKKVEQKLEKQILRYEQIIEGTDIGTWEWHIPSGKTVYNERWASILGYQLSELNANNIQCCNSLTHPDDLIKSNALLEEHFKGHSSFYECELRLRHKEGHWVWIQDKGKVIYRDKDGKPLLMTGSHLEITERRRQFERNKAFIDQSPSAIAMLDENLKFLRASQKWLDEYQLTEEHILGKSVYDAFPTLPERWKNIHQECLMGATRNNKGEKILLGNGEYMWMSWDMRPWYSAPNVIGGILIFTENVTSEVEKEVESKRIEEILEKTNEIARIGTWELDLKKNKVYWSRVTKEIHEVGPDFTPNLETGINFYRKGHSRNTIEKAVEEAIAKGTPFDLELEIETAKNKCMWIRAIGQSEFEGDTCIRVYGLFQDVDKLKKSELALTKANDELNAILNSGYVSIIGTNKTGIITHFNKGAQSLLQYSPQEMIGKHSPTKLHLHEELDFRAKVLSKKLGVEISAFQALTEMSKHQEFESREWTFVRKNGTTFPVQLVVTAIRNSKNEITGFLGVAVDISDLKNAENEIKALFELSQDQNDRLQNFAQIVSHNLRSHSSNFELLLSLGRQENPSLINDTIYQNLVEASQNLDNTILHLNEVVKINNVMKESMQPVKLHTAIEFTLQGLRELAREAEVQFHNELSEKIEVHVLPAYLDSILLNIISNAIKYSAPSRDSYVKFETEISANYTVLKVEDNGLGINMSKHGDKIFGMYKTFHGNDNARGIGLFITKNQIEAMGGKIEVLSEVDKGSTFKIYFKN